MVKARRIVRGDAQKRPLRWSKNNGRNWKKKRVVTEVWVEFFLGSIWTRWAWLSFFFCGRWMRGLETTFWWISVGPKKIASFPFQDMFNHETHCELQIFFGRTQGYGGSGIWCLIGFFGLFGMGTSQEFCELWICGFVALRVFSIARHWGKRFSGFFLCKDMQTLIND